MATKKLLLAEKVNFLINRETFALAVQVAEEDSKDALKFKPFISSGKPYTRFSSTQLLQTICKIMKWDVRGNRYKANGIYVEEEKAIIFDLYTAKVYKRGFDNE